MEFFVTDTGDLKKVVRKLENMGKKARNTTPVMRLISFDMMEVEKKVFASNGRRGGGGWRKLKDDTIRKKGTSVILRTEGAREKYSSIGHNALFKSLTEPEAAYQVWNVKANSVEFGTNRPYAGVHQEGSSARHIPARPFLRFIPSDMTRWENMVKTHLMQGFAE